MAPRTSPNFAFLAEYDPLLATLGADAERQLFDDPVLALLKLRQLAEVLAKRAAAAFGLYLGPQQTQADLIERLHAEGALTPEARELFHGLRKAGNAAAHEARGTQGEALHQLKMARQLAIWFHRTFGPDPRFNPGPFVPPVDSRHAAQAIAAELERLREALSQATLTAEQLRAVADEEARRRLSAEERARNDAEERAVWQTLAEEAGAKLAAQLAAAQHAATVAPAPELRDLHERALAAAEAIDLDEADTRRLVDAQLRAAGWEADSESLRYGLGARPKSGRNLAIAEWPSETGPADYVLFAGLDAIGVVEAKRRAKDVPASIEQAKRYAKGLAFTGGAEVVGGPWGSYRAPFLFATNGRPFLRQLATKSGVWFLDGRRPTNHPRPLDSWYTPEGLRELLKVDVETAHAALAHEPTDYLGLRDYQLRAIRAVEDALANDDRNCLVAMATGTGKTRTFIGLVYRLVKASRFRRVLFLVDRNALGEQAIGAFQDARLENLQTFTSIYGVKGLADVRPDADTKLHFATIQAMVKRVLYPSDEAQRPPVDSYDCIVVDECHRGFILDKELSGAELTFRDEDDFISKYVRVLDHFDAVKIGLTATPAQHTAQIFGPPVFTYSYREAVLDGWLIDHEPPTRILTELSKEGIRWSRGDEVEVLDPRSAQVQLFQLPDELAFDVDDFNTRVLTDDFNRVVCDELAKHIDPRLEGKTLVFCANDAHADTVVTKLKEAFDRLHGAIDDDAVAKITGAADRPLALIRRYKNEAFPSVAVTVDLLTTGIDVPVITNLVFIRRVRSRILYEQMLGRATRPCPAIRKESFRIFDAVGIYEALEPYTDMKPVVANPAVSFQELAESLAATADDAVRREIVEQLAAKLQRKRHALAGEAAARFEELAGMPLGCVLSLLRHAPTADAAEWLRAHAAVAPLLDEARAPREPVFIYRGPDAHLATSHDYPDGTHRPQDFLEAFGNFLQSSRNALPALTVVLTRPRDLTRRDLKELKKALDAGGYSEAALQTAYRETTNQDIAASIIGFIRQRALGEPLVPYAQRVRRAVDAVLAAHPWTLPQRKWLERIGAQLEREVVVDREALDHDQFAAHGGFAQIDKTFGGQLETILSDLRDRVWSAA